MRSVKYRPKPGSASSWVRSVASRPGTSSTTSGTPSANIRAEVRLSASVSVMAPTCVLVWPGRKRGPAPAQRGGAGAVTVVRRSGPVRSRALDHLVGPQGVRVAGRGREIVAATLVRTGEVLRRLPGPIRVLAAPPRVDQVLVGALQGAQQLEPLEALGLLHRARPAAETLLEALLLVGRHGDGIDLHDAHAAPLPGPADTQSRMLEG